MAQPKKALSAKGALAHLAGLAEIHPEKVVEAESITRLGVLLGWDRSRASKQLKAWQAAGRITVGHGDAGRLVIRVLPDRTGLERAGGPSQSTAMPRGKRSAKRAPRDGAQTRKSALGGRAKSERTDRAIPQNSPEVSSAYPSEASERGTFSMAVKAAQATNFPADDDTDLEAAASTPSSVPPVRHERVPEYADQYANHDMAQYTEQMHWRIQDGDGGGRGDRRGDGRMPVMDLLILIASIALAAVAGWLSINGMVVLFPGAMLTAIVLGCSLEGAKLVTAGWLGQHWGLIGWAHRLALLFFIGGVASINAIGVYSQLVVAHLGPRGALEATTKTNDADAAARIEVAQGRLADIDKRLGQIDLTVEGAANRGRARAATNAMRDQRQARAALATEREQVAKELADLRAARTGIAAKSEASALEAAPLQYVAELMGIHRGGEEIIRWMVAGIVTVTDPFALALASALASRRRRWRV